MADKHSFKFTVIMDDYTGNGIFSLDVINIPLYLYKDKKVKSISQGKRLVDQGAVSINGEKITSYCYSFNQDVDEYVIRFGKIAAPIKLRMERT